MKYLLLSLTLILSSPVMSSDNYDIEMVRSNNNGSWGAIRYQPKTGRSWVIKGGIFVEVLERTIPVEGKYKIKMVQTKKGWSATRIEVSTGKGWYLKNSMWEPILETKKP